MSILPEAILPDVEVDMTIRLGFAAVKAVLSQIPDSQVMIGTIARRELSMSSFNDVLT